MRALELPSRVHQLDIVDNELAIVALLESTEGGRKGGKQKAKNYLARNKQMAQEFESRRAKSRKSNSALMKEIGTAHNLGRSAAIAAINAGQKILSGRRGKPNG
jgi:hypothetical protein